MGVRNCREIGENLQKIVSRLMANDKLVNLLYYTGKDPYNEPYLNEKEKKEKIYEKLIKIVPRVGPKETATSVVVVSVSRARNNPENNEFRDIQIKVEVFIPMTQWIIKDSNLRPFAILGEIQDSLNNKTINGLGKMVGGDFDLNFISEEVCCYLQTFRITTYD